MALPRCAAAVALALAGCAATATEPSPESADARCVVSVAPQMRMVTFAAPAGLDHGVTSLFFARMPDVAPGDLVHIESRPGQAGPVLEKVDGTSETCAEVARAAADHHRHH